MILLLILFLSINVSALRVNYNLFEGNLTFNGDLIKTSKQINNVNILGFACLNQNCSRLGNKIFDLNSGNNSSITLAYPQILQSTFGYAVYYFKDNFIPWESNPDWFGSDDIYPKGQFNIYLTKKELCSSFVTNFSVINSEKPFMPLQISADIQLNASTLASVKNSGPLDAVPSGLIQHYRIRQLLRLTITNETNSTVLDQTQREFINFSGSRTFNFAYIPEHPGKYTIKLQSRVIDSKCLSSLDIFSSKTVNIYEQEPKNMCYTLLNNINLNKFTANPGETIIITGKKVSNRIN